MMQTKHHPIGMIYRLRLVAAWLCCCGTGMSVAAQCMYYPIPLSQRIQQAEYIVLAKVVGRQTYPDPVTNYIHTLNKLSVTAWLKNQQATREVYVITLGGVYQGRATRAWPSLQLQDGQEYVLFLGKDSYQADNKSVRRAQPEALQVTAYAGAQGALRLQNGMYIDLLAEPPMDEPTLFSRIQALTRQPIVTPLRQPFAARRYVAPPATARVQEVSSFSPTVTHAGTIEPGDFITITGSGFGDTRGTVQFRNADDGGSSYITPPAESDYVSWSDNSITVKVPDLAGTGDFRVNNSLPSGGTLTIPYAHYSVTDDFQGFSTPTRQRVYLRNQNGQGGYTFLFNNTLNNNAQAVAAFERALDTWRCATGINFRTGGTTSVSRNGDDGVNLVFFDETLDPGTLAQTVASFDGASTGSCRQGNTVWWFSDIDIRFSIRNNWNFSAANPASNQYDFESVALHELGHAHGLAHVIAPNQVMHYSITNGARIRTLSPADIEGGVAKLAYSTVTTCFNPDRSGTPMQLAPMTGCTTSGVVFIDFTGQRISNTTNRLEWTTEQETGSAGFHVQRSADAVTFADIDFVPTKGPGIQRFSYTYEDGSAGLSNWYYRLRQINTNGQQKFSETLFIDGDEASAWRVYGSNQNNVVLVTGPSQGSIQLYNLNGQLIYKGSLQAGLNTIQLRKPATSVYFCRITTTTATFTKKVVLNLIR